jgi:hypothetical protein
MVHVSLTRQQLNMKPVNPKFSFFISNVDATPHVKRVDKVSNVNEWVVHGVDETSIAIAMPGSRLRTKSTLV